MPIVEDPQSALVEALDRRSTDRKTWMFEAAKFLAAGAPKVGSYRMRLATIDEQDNAILMARRHVEEKVEKARVSGEMVKDPDLGNAKIAYLMHAVCLQPERDVPVFQSGKWMCERLTPDEVSVLLNHYQEIVELSGPIDLDLSTERIEGLAASLAATAGTSEPNLQLMAFTRHQVVEICIREALLLKEARSEIARLKEELEAAHANQIRRD